MMNVVQSSPSMDCCWPLHYGVTGFFALCQFLSGAFEDLQLFHVHSSKIMGSIFDLLVDPLFHKTQQHVLCGHIVTHKTLLFRLLG